MVQETLAQLIESIRDNAEKAADGNFTESQRAIYAANAQTLADTAASLAATPTGDSEEMKPSIHARLAELERGLEHLSQRQRESEHAIAEIRREPREVSISGPITVRMAPDGPGPAVKVQLTITGASQMSNVVLSIDDTTGALSQTWTDDHGNTDAPAPEGFVPAPWAEDTTVLTIDPATQAITPLKEGTTTITDPIADASGTPLNNAAGVAFGPASVTVEVGPGLAVSVVEDATA